MSTALACAAPTDDRTAELAAREAGNPGGENFGEFGPPDAYEGDSPHPYYGSENEWSRRMFDERAADLYYKRRGQRQLLEILDGNPGRALELADARIAVHPTDAESQFIRATALTQLDRIDEAEEAMRAALDAGMPPGRFLAGPRELLEPLAATDTFTAHAARPKNAIVHGPMLGAVTDTSARIWIRTTEETRFEVLATTHAEHHTATGSTSADRDFTGTATLEGLSPDTSYTYKVLVEANTPQQPLQPPSQSYTLRTSPRPDAAGTFVIAFGGCAGYTPENERMWDTIAGHTPQALLLLGDNVYIDLPEVPGPFHDYTYYQRQSRPEFRRLVSSTPVYAIWDDHDAAIDDIWMGPYVDRPPWKQPMVDLFRRNWNNPAYGSESHPGVLVPVPLRGRRRTHARRPHLPDQPLRRRTHHAGAGAEGLATRIASRLPGHLQGDRQPPWPGPTAPSQAAGTPGQASPRSARKSSASSKRTTSRASSCSRRTVTGPKPGRSSGQAATPSTIS